MKKRILSILLAVIMTVSLLPGAALAEQMPCPDPDSAVEEAPHETYGTTNFEPVLTHSHDETEFTVEINTLTDLKNLFASGGNGYLTANITADAGLTVTATPVNLCLNGYVLDLAGNAGIKVNSGTSLFLYDCGTAEHKFGETADGLWIWDDTLTGSDVRHTVTGGVITGGHSVWGGGVNNEGTFALKGGNIVGCLTAAASGGEGGGAGTPAPETGESTFRGGAVYNKSQFQMRGGKILGCVSSETGGAIFNEGTALLMGGLIDSCTAKNGGAIYNIKNDEADFLTLTAIITNCSATGASADGQGYGGGIYNGENAKVVMTCTIDKCSAAVFGGGVFNGGTFTMNENAAINYCSAEKGGAVHQNGGSAATFTMNGGSMSGNTADTGSAVQNSEGATFNLFGGTVTGNTANNAAGGAVFSKGTLNVKGKITVTNNTNRETPSQKSNVVLGSPSACITISDALDAASRIGVFHAKKENGVYVPDPSNLAITAAGNGATSNAPCFISDYPAYTADFNNNGTVGITDDDFLTLTEIGYGIFVGSVSVTEENKDNILGNGKVSYDPATNTLTLNGLSLSKAQCIPLPDPVPQTEVASASGEDVAYAHIYTPGNLNLVINGSNTIAMDSSTSSTASGDEYGVYCGGSLTVSGNGELIFDVSAAGGSSGVYSGDEKPGGWSAQHDAKALIYASNSVTVNSGTYINTGLPWSAIRSRNITINDGTFDFTTYGHCIYSENFGGTQSLMDEKIKLTVNGGELKLSDDRENPTYSSDMNLGMYSLFGQKDVIINGGEITIASHNGICGDRVVISGSDTKVKIMNNEDYDHHVSTHDVGILAEWSWIKLEDGCTVDIDIVQRDDSTKAGNNFILKGGAVEYNDLTEKADTKLTAPGSKLYLNGKPVIFFVYPEDAPYTKAHTSLQAYIDAVGEEPTTIALPDNITEKITIAAGQNIFLDLNGYTLSGGCGSTAAEDGHVIVNNGTLTIRDSSDPSIGKITGGNAFFGGAIYSVGSTALEGGTITGCKAVSTSYDTADSKLGRGGAVYVPTGGVFLMKGGKIDTCTASVAGGAIYSCNNVGMSGGKITNCSVGGVSDEGTVKAKGGAVYMLYGIMAMLGGEISGNTLGNVADMRGAGVYIATDAHINLGGTAKITGNTNGAGKASNLFLYTGATASIGNGSMAPQTGMKVGVTTKVAPANGTTVPITDNGTSGQVSYFTADDSSLTVKFDTDHLVLAEKPAESDGGSGGGKSKYTVTVKTAENGAVTADKKNVSAGDTVTVTVTPKEGFTLEKLTVLDKSNKEIKLKTLGNNRFSFTMPESNVTVSATFTESGATAAPDTFADVAETDYFHDAVLWAAKNGITSGMDATHFAPLEITTRAQMVTFLWRASGSPAPTKTTCAFTDVSADKYYYKAILWAIEEGITVGTTATTFTPDAAVSRAQAVTFLARLNGVMDEAADFVHNFTDVHATDYFNNAVAWASASGITSGTTATTFSPYDNCLRGQIVTFLYRNFAK